MRFLTLIASAAVLADDNALGQETTSAVTKEAEREGLVLLGLRHHLCRARLPGICAAYLHGGPRLAASRDSLQLRESRNRIDVARLQFRRRRKTGVGDSRRCWAACSAIRPASHPATSFRLAYWKLELSSEGEFVFDTGDSEGSFFYNWSELSLSPVEWFRFGLVGQRTRAYQTDVDIQRGLLVGFSYKKMDFTTYVFNLDQGKPTWVFAVGVSF